MSQGPFSRKQSLGEEQIEPSRSEGSTLGNLLLSGSKVKVWISLLQGWGRLQPGASCNLWIWSLQVLSPLCWVFQLMSSLLGPGSLLLSWHLGLSGGYPQFPIPHCYTPLFNFLTLCTSPPSPPIPDSSPFTISIVQPCSISE